MGVLCTGLFVPSFPWQVGPFFADEARLAAPPGKAQLCLHLCLPGGALGGRWGGGVAEEMMRPASD